MNRTPPSEWQRVVHTVGHSTRSFDEFARILAAHEIRTLADVRQYPRSRRHPHFNDESLSTSLPALGVNYIHMKALGGRRKATADSINIGWRSEAFRGYADYMQTDEFRTAIDQLERVAHLQSTAIMCAEAVPWRCHRSLISDALLARGWRVLDIFDEKAAKDHALTPFAEVHGAQVTYPAADSLF